MSRVTGVSSIAIIVPVLGRPQQAAPLIASIRTSTTVPYRVLFICSPGDDAARDYGRAGDMLVVEWEPGEADFAKKTNRGLAETTEEFVFCGATDLTFTPGWDTAALEVAEQTGACVIGTQDGANPNVIKGKHSTHSLVRRSYAEERGCTVDGTGAIYCELYSHQAVDAELCETAMHRGVWAFAHESRVLHHHPMYDRKVKRDATYNKALEHGQEDIRLFMQRRHLWVQEKRRTRRAAAA